MRRPPATILGLCATMALTGCGTVTLDSGKVAGLMRQLLVNQAGLEVRAIRCPPHIKEGKGIVTSCTATLTDGHTVRMSATQTRNGIQVAPAEMIADEIQDFIVRVLAKRGVTVSATCPQHQPIIVGRRFECVASDRDGHSVKVRVTVTSPSAAFRIQFATR